MYVPMPLTKKLTILAWDIAAGFWRAIRVVTPNRTEAMRFVLRMEGGCSDRAARAWRA